MWHNHMLSFHALLHKECVGCGSDEEYLSELGLHREDRGTRERVARIARRYEEQIDALVDAHIHEDDIDEAIYVMDHLMGYES
jgi:hypothetical protein